MEELVGASGLRLRAPSVCFTSLYSQEMHKAQTAECDCIRQSVNAGASQTWVSSETWWTLISGPFPNGPVTTQASLTFMQSQNTSAKVLVLLPLEGDGICLSQIEKALAMTNGCQLKPQLLGILRNHNMEKLKEKERWGSLSSRGACRQIQHCKLSLWKFTLCPWQDFRKLLGGRLGTGRKWQGRPS